ncbi:MAG: hypothetical protein CMH46_07615 [Muricauda sp.]|nr:helix-turn-helix domain-containing protein [Allomuricauda sp.]MAU15391.1 hypothetical protein [Allomuricauda sp.]|tara:strand:+ start:1524 stop:2486 length:963 start_codon:yes stop_codon:yes gene_type:complete
MDSLENKNRLDKIYTQLLHIANGYFFYQIERSERNDELEALAFLANSAAEELRDAFLHQGFVDLDNSYDLIVQLFFELDPNGQITRTNPSVEALLHYNEGDLNGLPFRELLTKDSQKGWKKLMEASNMGRVWEMTVKLTFIERTGLHLPANCHIVHFPQKEREKGTTMVTAFDMARNARSQGPHMKKQVEQRLRYHNLLPKPQKRKTYILHVTDFENLRVAERYIMEHLDRPLPSIKELAHLCGTNEFKFKNGFKELFGMSAFQYQKRERLRKAHILIEHSNRTILAIAKTVGFKKGNHFAREFKKRYGYTPTQLRKLSK